MNLPPRVFLSIGAILLLVLVALRVTAPEEVVGRAIGFMLNIGWALMLFLGLAEWKRLSIHSGSAGKPITLISAFLVAGATDFILSLGFLSESDSNPILVAFFFAVTAIIFLAWWKILRMGEQNDS